MNKEYVNFKNMCLSEEYHAFIATRAVITAQVVKMNSTNGIENLKFTMTSYELLKKAADQSIKSMQEYLDKMQTASVPRGVSSPALHKQVADSKNVDAAVIVTKSAFQMQQK